MPFAFPTALFRATVFALLTSTSALAQDYPVELGESFALPTAAASSGAAAGSSVAHVSGWIAVGAPGADGGRGRVDLFEEIADVWVGPSVLLSPLAAVGNGFGRALAADGDTLVVGEAQGSFPPSGPGRVHVYVLSGSSWQWQATLSADDGVYGDQFGRALDLDGDRLVIGAPYDDQGALQTGAAYVFDRVGSSWSQTARLIAQQPEAGAQFGRAVAVDGDTVLVGAWLANTVGADSGSAFVFVEDGGGSFSQQAQLLPSAGAAGDLMGISVALIGDIALVGAPSGDNIATNAGVVRRFDRALGVWTQGSFPAPVTVVSGDNFGRSLAYDQGLLAVGAPDEAPTSTTPADNVYVFSFSEGVFTEDSKLLGIGDVHDQYGRAVAVGPSGVVGGAPFADAGLGEALVTPLVKLGYTEDLGQSLPGTSGAPVISLTGTLIGLTPYSFNLSNALAGATSLLIVGASRIDVPFKQGVLVPNIDFILNVSVAGDGTASAGGDEWPNDPPGGFSIFLQWWVVDPGAVEGFAASNAIEAFVPPF